VITPLGSASRSDALPAAPSFLPLRLADNPTGGFIVNFKPDQPVDDGNLPPSDIAMAQIAET
jgi:hypothetical protein